MKALAGLVLATLVVCALTVPAAAAAPTEGFSSGPVMSVPEAAERLRDRAGTVGGARAALRTQIVGGGDAADGRWPMMASLNVVEGLDGGDDRAGHFCGGTVVAREWVLTAAHCVTEPSGENFEQELIPAELMEVIVDRTRLSTDEGETLGVVEIVVADGWWSGERAHDLGLLRLTGPAAVAPGRVLGPDDALSVPPSGTLDADGTVWTVGWGSVEPGDVEVDASDELQELAVPLWSESACAETDATLDGAVSLCAGPRLGDAPADACYGDSGGPLMRLDNHTGAWAQLGVVSRASPAGMAGCAEPGAPTVYTRVAAFADQITAVTGAGR